MPELRTLLMVVHDFPPLRSSGVYRPVKFAKYLPEFGWKAHILTIAEPTTGALDRALLAELPAVTKISRASAFGLKDIEQKLFSAFFRRPVEAKPEPSASPSNEVMQRSASSTGKASFSPLSLMKRLVLSPLSRYTHNHVYVPDIRIGWKNPAIALGREILRTETIDAIYSTSAPETPHLVAQALHAESKLPWIVEYRDPWYHNFTRDQYPASRLRRELELQSNVMHEATAIVYTAPRMREHNKQTFPELDPGKQFVISNGYDEANFGDTSIRYQPAPEESLKIVHVGTIYEHSTFTEFLTGMETFYRQSGEHQNVRLSFIGDPGAGWQKYFSREPFAGQVDLLGFKPHQEAVRLMRTADVLLLTIPNDGRRFPTDYNVPGKVFELIRAERPILMIGRAGDTADIVRECGAGEVVSPDSPELIAQAVTKLVEQKKTGNLAGTSNLSALAKYDRRTQTGELTRILNQIVSTT